MSGIAGYVGKSSKEVLKKMLQRIKHRGPDKEKTFTNKSVSMGIDLLQINKSDDGLFYNQDKSICVVVDGTIYNSEKLIDNLKEYEFKTKSSEEVILRGYEKWGTKIFEKLNGEFAIAIYDKNVIYLARDGYGSKPLYYYFDHNNFMFASESKAFLDHPNFIKEFNEEILECFLCFNSVPTKETFFKNVFKLTPGSIIEFKDNKISETIFYRLKFNKKEDSMDNFVDQIEKKVIDSINMHNEKARVGSFLSSGIDSSYIVSVLKPKCTYTIGYENLNYDEVSYAKDLAKILKIKNKTKILNSKDYIKPFKNLMYYMDEPLANPSLPAIYYLAKMSSKDVDVIFSGEGADELFGGYLSYQEEISQTWYMKIPYFVRHLASNIASLFPDAKGFNFIYRRGQKLEDYFIGLGRVFRDKEALSIIKNKNQIKPMDVVKPYYEMYKKESTMVQRQVIDYYFWLINDFTFAVDRTSSMFGLKGATPYLDKNVIDVATSLPDKYKIGSNTTKIALRNAAQRTIPNESYKKKKLGFPVPLREWLKEDEFYQEVKSKFNSDTANKYFDIKKINTLLDNHYHNKKDNFKKIWAIYSFIVWYEVYFNEGDKI